MKKLFPILIAFALLCSACHTQEEEVATFNFDNTCWFDGYEFFVGSHDTITIGYNPLKDIELYSSEPSEQIHIGPGIFLPDGVSCGDDNSCIYTSSITVSGYSGTISSANDIKYVRLNLEHSNAAGLNIRLKCPNDTIVNILYPQTYEILVNNDCFDESDFPNWWIGSEDGTTILDYDYPQFGIAEPDSDPNCDSLSTNNVAGTGWNYCWSSNTTSGYQYALNDGIIYREVYDDIVDVRNIDAGFDDSG